MRITIIGAGGVGGYFGARLAQGGCDVGFVARGAHLAALREHGLRVESRLGDIHLPRVRVSDDPAALGPADMVFLCVKLWDTETALRAASPILGPQTAIISFQNGVQKDDVLRRTIGADRVIGGVGYIGSKIARPGVISHTGTMQRLVFGEYDGSKSPRVVALYEACLRGGIDAEISDDIRRTIWEKFVFLVGLSATTTVMLRTLGPIVREPGAREYLLRSMREVVAVGRAHGVDLPEDFAEQRLSFCDGLPAEMDSSMHADFENGKRLEVDWLSGAVVELGKAVNVATPVNQSTCNILAPHAQGNAGRRMNHPHLTIRSLHTVFVSVPMKFPLGTSAVTVRSAPLLLVDLETEEGITGRTYLFCYMPLGAQLMARALQDLVERVKGDAIDPEKIATKLQQQFRLIGAQGVIWMAMAGLDVACWDALAQAAGVPLVRFLGGTSKPVPAYNSNGLGLMSPDACADEAEKLLEGGFRAVKLRLGYTALDGDLAAARAVRKRVPAEIAIMADYNQALSVDEALRRGCALDDEGLAWIEEPIRHDDYSGCAAIARELKTPIQIGENFLGVHAMEAATAANSADLMMPDLMRIGGVTGWLQAASIAGANGIKLSSHLFPEVSSHLLAVTPTQHWLEYVDWAAPVLEEPLRVVNGMVTPSNRPGTGIRWNQEAVKRFRAE